MNKKHYFVTVSSNKIGFTLIELLVSIAIIGILATMVVLNIMGSMRRGRDAKRKSDLAQVSKSLEMYYNDMGQYPLSDGAGQILGCGATRTDACMWGTSVFGDEPSGIVYMIKLPTDPKSNEQYFYESADGTYYRVFAHLENTGDPNYNGNGYVGSNCGTTEGGGPFEETIDCTYGVASPNVVLETAEIPPSEPTNTPPSGPGPAPTNTPPSGPGPAPTNTPPSGPGPVPTNTPFMPGPQPTATPATKPPTPTVSPI